MRALGRRAPGTSAAISPGVDGLGVTPPDELECVLAFVFDGEDEESPREEKYVESGVPTR